MEKLNLLVSGLGGGLDIVNASLLYFAHKIDSNQPNVEEKSLGKCYLGSARPAPLSCISQANAFAPLGAEITASSIINKRGRYAEPVVSKYFNEPIIYFSRQVNSRRDGYDPEAIRHTIHTAVDLYQLKAIVFVDGGGDSLIMHQNDAGTTTEKDTTPYQGGDAQMLYALRGLPNVYHAVISVGLDIDEAAFRTRVDQLRERGGYFGRVNLRTGEKDEYLLDHLISFSNISAMLEQYFAFAESLLVLEDEHVNDPTRTMSHTATVTYHALKGSFGVHRTYVPWEPTTDGMPGVLVQPDHCWMYFFDPRAVEALKDELNAEFSFAKHP